MRADKTNLRFGRLLVISFQGQNKHGQAQWLCRCDCGNTTVVRGFELATGGTKSCGCLRYEAYHFSHRKSGTPTYSTWKAMRKRCNNPNYWQYKHYGLRGIKVCEQWSSFETFLADMGEKPIGQSIDRIDPDGNYEPSNCRWATVAQQAQNKRVRKNAEEKLP